MASPHNIDTISANAVSADVRYGCSVSERVSDPTFRIPDICVTRQNVFKAEPPWEFGAHSG